MGDLHGAAAERALARASEPRCAAAPGSARIETEVDRSGDVVVKAVLVEGEQACRRCGRDRRAARRCRFTASSRPKRQSGSSPAWADLGVSPIVDVHLVFDTKVTDLTMAAALDSPVQFVFDKTDASGHVGPGQALSISVSGADDEHGERPEILIERYRAAVVDLFPRARGANLIDAVVSREHGATFRGRPGTQALRPQTTTGIANLFLAGAWTDTGWPATMEGAVRSGNRAAWHALRVLDRQMTTWTHGRGARCMTTAVSMPDVLGRARESVAPALRAAVATPQRRDPHRSPSTTTGGATPTAGRPATPAGRASARLSPCSPPKRSGQLRPRRPRRGRRRARA